MTDKNFKLNAAIKKLYTLFYCSNAAVILIFTITKVNSFTDLSTNNFDHLIFSQRWLPSSCLLINEHCESSNCCKLPDNFTVWAIHGLWPQYKNSFGPFFCNKSEKFNKTLIDPIRPTLSRLWPNIEKKKTSSSLWEHEWLKHGTCTIVLEKLNNEFKYFNMSLKLFEDFNMNKLFEIIKIKPNNEGVDIKNVLTCLSSKLGKYPYLHCSKEIKKGETYLVEVRLCYDLNLELMDCGIPNNNELKAPLSLSLTNCPTDSLILLPHSINSSNNAFINRSNKFLLRQYSFELLKIVKSLLWISL